LQNTVFHSRSEKEWSAKEKKRTKSQRQARERITTATQRGAPAAINWSKGHPPVKKRIKDGSNWQKHDQGKEKNRWVKHGPQNRLSASKTQNVGKNTKEQPMERARTKSLTVQPQNLERVCQGQTEGDVQKNPTTKHRHGHRATPKQRFNKRQSGQKETSSRSVNAKIGEKKKKGGTKNKRRGTGHTVNVGIKQRGVTGKRTGNDSFFKSRKKENEGVGLKTLNKKLE